MKIAYVYDAIYPWETGGVQKRIWELGRRLADDHDVHWYGLRYWDGPDTRTLDGMTLHGVGPPRDLYVNGRRSFTEPVAYAAQLARSLDGTDFDVIDCQGFPYFPAFPSKLKASITRSTLVLTWHEVWDDYWYDYLGWKGAIGRFVERVTAKLPNVHVAVSEQTRRDLGRLGVRQAALVPNGVDMEAVGSVRGVDEPVDLLFVGRLIDEKNADLHVRAVDRVRDSVPDVRSVIVGDGPERESIERLVERLGLESNVDLVGFEQSQERVLGLMKAADVFSLPSRREGFGMTVLEAMACGTPVVTIEHARNASRDLIDHGETGFVCEPTPDALARGLLRARTLSGNECVEAACAYDWTRITERVEDVYRGASG